jgi:hypothetical protein
VEVGGNGCPKILGFEKKNPAKVEEMNLETLNMNKAKKVSPASAHAFSGRMT